MKQIKAASRKHAASVADKYIREDGTDPNKPKTKRVRLAIHRPDDDPGIVEKPKARDGTDRGRGTKYRPEFARRAKKLMQAGLTNLEICERFGISHQTFYVWRGVHPDFREATARVHGDEVDDRVEAVALHCAIKAAEDPAYQQTLKLWLQNRRRDKWYRGPVDASTPINMQINFPFGLAELAKATPKQLEQLQQQLAKFNPSFVQAHQGMLIDATAAKVETAQRALDDHSISDDEAFGDA